MATKHKLFRVQNDTGEPINFTVLLDNAVKDLTGCSVDFIMKSPTGAAINSGHTACTLVSPTAGTCRYDFAVGDLAEVGTYTCDLQLTNSDGTIVTEYTEYDIVTRAENG
jgi:hypothetical protein